MRKFFQPKRLIFLGAAMFIAAAGLMFIFSQKKALAAVTVDTSTASGATQPSSQRKTWHDGTRYWVAFYSGSDIEFWYSTNGSSWTQNTSATLTTSNALFSIEADSSNAYIVHPHATSGVAARKASSYPGTSFSWGSSNQIYNAGTDLIDYVSITRGTDGKLCVAASHTGDNVPFNNEVDASISTNADDVTSWGTKTLIDSDSTSTTKYGVSVAALAGGHFYATWNREGTIYGNKYSGSWAGSPTSIAASASTTLPLSLVSSTSADKAFLIYINSSGNVLFRDYDDGTTTWSSAVTLDSDTTNTHVVISIDKTNGDALYAAWRDSASVLYYKKGVSTYASGNWDTNPTTLSSASNIQDISSTFRDGGGKMSFIWTEGSGSPYNVRYESITLQSAPAAPTLSAPASGATGVSLSPAFTFSTTDGDGDYIGYRLYLYQSDCSTAVGASPFTQPDGTPQTGWSGQNTQTSTAYTSGSTATYTQQSALSPNTTYCWKADARDPGGSNTYGTASATRLFTTNAAPAIPTLIQPSSSQTAIPLRPQFQLRTTDADNDYLRYHIKVYSAQTECNSDSATNLVRSIDQTSSQTGWAGQDQQTATAYTGAVSIANSRIAAHNYQPNPFSPNTTYWWKGRAKDPGGADTWSSWATCTSFTTATTDVRIQGGVNIRGGSRIQ